MSRRLSQKSELSPSITRGGDGIDLGKNSGVDIGRKSQPSMTSGGIGISQEVTSVGGASLSAGVEVDLTPVDFGVCFSDEGNVAVSGGAEIPGGLLGVSGGLEIDLNTGEVIGGSVGAEVGGLGVNVSNSKKGGIGIEFTVQIPGTPIELSIGLGFPPESPTPTPTPSPSPSTITGLSIPGDKSCKNGKYTLVANTRYFDTIHGKSGDWVVSVIERINARIAYDLYNLEGEAGDTRMANNRWGEGNWQIEVRTIESTEKFGSWMYISSTAPATYSIPMPGTLSIIRAAITVVFTRTVWVYSSPGRDYHLFSSGYKSVAANIINIDSPPPCPGGDLPPPSPFPNPPPRKNKKMDECCRQNLAFLRLIYTKLGLAKFPGQLPNTIIQEIQKEGEQPAEPPQVPIPDLVSLLNWQFERDDERWGQWEIQINIKDADLTKEGAQGKSVKFPNLAESVAEIEGQMLSIQTNVEALVALSIRTLAEAGMGRQEAIKGYLASMAIAKYMAFPYKEFDVEIPSTYTPGATSIDKLVVESVVHAKGINYEDKETQRDLFLDLLQAAAITRAVHWRQVNPKSNIKEQILSQLRGSVDLSEKITNVKAVVADGDTPPKKESWEDKLDQYENGFGFSTGIENANTPYGRDRERRPRIRQIGDNIAQAGKDE